MNNDEQRYLDLLRTILETGNDRTDRTGIGTKSIFGTTLRFDLTGGTLPIMTTKKTFYRGAIEEMLFFVRGENDTKKLEAKGVNIWKGNTSREFLDKQGKTGWKEGNLGELYGRLWRKWGYWEGGYTLRDIHDPGIDQLAKVFMDIKTDPYSRRHVVSAWNVAELDNAVLYPCHTMFQFYVDDGTLSCMFNMRSCDAFLGLPFNIVGYALLTHLMAAATGLTAREVIFVGGDTHLYSNHVEQAKTQIAREPHPFPKLTIKKLLNSLRDIEGLTFEDLEITGYMHHEAIKAEMAI